MHLRNLWICFLVSGLWHGAAWHFVVWGGYHALLVTLEVLTKWPERLERAFGRGGAVTSWVIVMVGELGIARVLFRADSIEQAAAVLATMFNPLLLDPAPLALIYPPVMAIAGAMALHETGLFFGFNQRLAPWLKRLPAAEPAAAALLFCAAIFFHGPQDAFVYFQF